MLHSATGKIKKVLIIFNDTLSDIADPNELLGLRGQISHFPETVRVLEKNGIIVFIAAGFTPELFNDYEKTAVSKRAARFHHVLPIKNSSNERNSCMFLQTDYTQDVFDFAAFLGNESLIFNTGCFFFFEQLIQVALDSKQLELHDCADFPAGGNMLFGGIGRVNYVLTSTMKWGDRKLHAESVPYYYPTLKVCSVPNNYPKRLSKSFFHVDLYLTICGIVPELDPEKEMIFVAAPVSNNDITQAIAAEWLKQIREQIQAFFIREQFPVVLTNLPAYIVDNGGSDCFTLSYNNCHVENYMEGNTRVIRIYFPDYTLPATQYLHGQTDLSEQTKKSRHRAWERLMRKLVVRTTKNNLIDHYNIDPIEVEDNIKELQRRLHNNLKAWGIEAIFIKDDFYNTVQNGSGGLHCIAKVIEREPMG